MIDQKIEMTTVSTVLEKLRIKKHDKEFRMTPEGFTPGNKKYYQSGRSKNYSHLPF